MYNLIINYILILKNNKFLIISYYYHAIRIHIERSSRVYVELYGTVRYKVPYGTVRCRSERQSYFSNEGPNRLRTYRKYDTLAVLYSIDSPKNKKIKKIKQKQKVITSKK